MTENRKVTLWINKNMAERARIKFLKQDTRASISKLINKLLNRYLKGQFNV